MSISKREIMDGFEGARAKTFIYMAKALIRELGDEKGRQVIRETVCDMSMTSGEATRESYLKQGIENTWQNHRDLNGPVYEVAWEGGIIVDKSDLKVVEYSYCPLAAGFERLGEEAEELGDIYCEITDNAFWAGFNPKWSVTREKKISEDGVCRLVWRKN
ncbi:MAG: L-2-amino-thiazoline-4-carboxylic acid hydrolase [Candidatus Bathyarchaeota archaeon]